MIMFPFRANRVFGCCLGNIGYHVTSAQDRLTGSQWGVNKRIQTYSVRWRHRLYKCTVVQVTYPPKLCIFYELKLYKIRPSQYKPCDCQR